MAAVIGWQIDAVGLVVRRDDDTAAIEHGMFAQVSFVDAQHVRRRGRVSFHVIVELKAVYVAEVARFAHAQDDGFQEAVEAAEHLLWGDFGEIPWADCMFYGL
jgi:hypothetical protein